MKLEYLKLTNFRGFRQLEIAFDPSFTVLLGPNMAGKTALLDGATLALNLVLTGARQVPEITDDDVRRLVADINGVADLQAQYPVVIEARTTARVSRNEPSTFRIRREGPDTATRFQRMSGALYALMPHGGIQTALPLPVIAQYGTQRRWLHSNTADDIRGVGSRYDGYTDCFDIQSTHGALAGWIRKQTLIQLQRGSGHVQLQLAAVESAVRSCIEDVTRFWYDVQYDELRLERPGGNIQSFGTLSEGIRNMVATVADIAWRASVLNPLHGSEAHLLTEGVVLIDELDLHLHPAWQRRIVADLRRTFPKIQFIVTTHSPQIVASVSRSQIRLLDNNRLVAEEPYVEGRASNEILEDVFGVSARPEAVQSEIDALYRLIEDEDFAAARTRLAALQERLGPDDTTMIKARWILETEDPRPSARAARTAMICYPKGPPPARLTALTTTPGMTWDGLGAGDRGPIRER
jgi:predicted ATP-binding protein involved in virulence